MDIGTLASWIQVGIWIVAVIAFVVRVQRGEARMPALLKNNLLIGIVIALGICGSIASVYLHYTHPKIVEKIVEKPVPVPCPEQKAPEVTPIPRSKPMKKADHIEANPVPSPKANVHTPPSQNCPNGICVGGELSGSATVNNYEGHKSLTMSTDQQVLVAGKLTAFKGQTLNVDVVNASEETDKFANDLISSLSSAGIVAIRSDMGQMVGGCLQHPGITFMAGINRSSLVKTIWDSLIVAKVVEERTDRKIPGCSRSGEPDELHIEIFRP